jgi:hypothetical protein
MLLKLISNVLIVKNKSKEPMKEIILLKLQVVMKKFQMLKLFNIMKEQLNIIYLILEFHMYIL